MRKILKKVLFCIVMVGILSTTSMEPIHAISIFYQNNLLQTDVEPMIESGRTLVPVAVIAQAMGATSKWDAKTKKVTITRGDLILHLTLGQKEWRIESPKGGHTAMLDVPAKSINGRTMVPLSAIAEAFGSEVSWDGETKTVLIDSDHKKLSVPVKQGQDSKTQEALRKTLSGIPGNPYDQNSINQAIFHSNNDPWALISMYHLRERVPGRYEIYTVEVDGELSTCLIETETNQAYHVFEGVYAMPNFKVAVPPSFDDEYSVEELIHALLIQQKQINGYDEINIQVSVLEDLNDYPLVWRGESFLNLPNGKNGKKVGDYAVDTYGRIVTDRNNGKVIYDDSAVMQYPEKKITAQNAGEETLNILGKLKALDANKKYSVTKVSDYGNTEEVEYREGYLVTVEAKDTKGKQPIDHTDYFINSTGTVVMIYNVVHEVYFYIYGSHTPMG